MQIENPSIAITKNYINEVAKGNIPAAFIIAKFGANSGIDTANPSDIWSGGSNAVGDQIFDYEGQDLPGAEILTVRSLSTADVNLTGIGAWQVLVEGLDADFNRIEEVVNLNGLASVSTNLEFLKQYRTTVITAGSTGCNQGKILVEAQTTSPVHGPDKIRMSQIDNGSLRRNQTTMSQWTVPANYTALVIGISASVYKKNVAVGCELEGNIRPLGSVFQTKVFEGLVTTGTSNINRDWSNGPRFAPPKTDFKIRSGAPTGNDLGMTGGYIVLCEKIDPSIPDLITTSF